MPKCSIQIFKLAADFEPGPLGFSSYPPRRPAAIDNRPRGKSRGHRACRDDPAVGGRGTAQGRTPELVAPRLDHLAGLSRADDEGRGAATWRCGAPQLGLYYRVSERGLRSRLVPEGR